MILCGFTDRHTEPSVQRWQQWDSSCRLDGHRYSWDLGFCKMNEKKNTIREKRDFLFKTRFAFTTVFFTFMLFSKNGIAGYGQV